MEELSLRHVRGRTGGELNCPSQPPFRRFPIAGRYPCGVLIMSQFEVPDQPLNPPEVSSVPDYWEYLEHEADRLNDEEWEREACTLPDSSV